MPIVSLDFFTLRAPRCHLFSHHHRNMTPPLARKNSMRLLNFLLMFGHLVDLDHVYLLGVSLSSILPQLPLLEQDRPRKYPFGSTCTTAGKNLENKRKIPTKT